MLGWDAFNLNLMIWNQPHPRSYAKSGHTVKYEWENLKIYKQTANWHLYLPIKYQKLSTDFEAECLGSVLKLTRNHHSHHY